MDSYLLHDILTRLVKLCPRLDDLSRKCSTSQIGSEVCREAMEEFQEEVELYIKLLELLQLYLKIKTK